MDDEDIQFDEDSPRTTPEDWARAVVHTGIKLPKKKTQIALRLDNDVLEWFKGQGSGYQTRINAILKAYKERTKKAVQWMGKRMLKPFSLFFERELLSIL